MLAGTGAPAHIAFWPVIGLWLTACHFETVTAAPAPAQPAPRPAVQVSERAPLWADARPEQLVSETFSYLDLPVAGTAERLSVPIAFTMRSKNLDQRVVFDTDIAGRLEIAGVRYVSEPFEARGQQKARAEGDEYGGPTDSESQGPALDSGAHAPCAADPTRTPKSAAFEGILRDGWTRRSLVYVRGTAALDAQCAGKVEEASKVVAPAIVPDLLYGFRRCLEGCDGKGGRREELVLLAPPSFWSASSQSPTEKPTRSGPFTILAIPLTPGSSCTALVHFDWQAMTYFVGLQRPGRTFETRDPKVYGQALEVTTEVAWPGDATSEVQGFVSVSSVTPFGREMLQQVWPPASK